MEKSGFFGSNNHDRIYQSDIINKFFSKLFTNGIFNNGCKVTANDNMTITLSEGWALINGMFYYNDSDKVLNVSIADANQSRIDNVVLRYSAEDRNIGAEIIDGAYADSPSAPSLERNTALYDLRIAKISVPKGTDKITTALIEDTRENSNDCGIVTGAVSQIDTTQLFDQYNAWFNAWFDLIKGQLSTDSAGNLQNEIDANNDAEWTVQEIADSDLSNWTYDE